MLRDEIYGVESDWTRGARDISANANASVSARANASANANASTNASVSASANVGANANANGSVSASANVGANANVGASANANVRANAKTSSAAEQTHREIDVQLRRIAKMRSGLDAEEARWLRLADEKKIWRTLGYVHALEYLEDVFGYAPRAAQERLRVAKELGALPAIAFALENGEVPWSIARELSRVATPATEARWLAESSGKNLRDVERLVAGHKKGDDPDDEPDRALEPLIITLRLKPSTIALLREVRACLNDEYGGHLDDDAAFEAMCRRVLEGVGPAAAVKVGAEGTAGAGVGAEGVEAAESTAGAGLEDIAGAGVEDIDGAGAEDVAGAASRAGAKARAAAEGRRPARMIHLTMCRVCKRATQNGAGVPFDLSDVEREVAECDAIVCDDENGKRASQTIPPAIRRQVIERDGYKCRFPGCRSSRNLDAHHLRWRSQGGGHETSNLGTLCSGHHHPVHDGVIEVHGDADGELTFVRNGIVIREGRASGVLPAAVSQTTGSGTTSSGAKASEKTAPETKTPETNVSSSASKSRTSSRYAEVERHTLTKAALKQAGFKPAEAARAVSRAAELLGSEASLEAWVREALKHTMT